MAFKLYKSRRIPTDTVPNGWFTAKEVACQKKVSLRYAQRILSNLFEDGSIQMKRLRVKTGLRTYPVPYYKFAKEVQS